jgi:hypothetical protein
MQRLLVLSTLIALGLPAAGARAGAGHTVDLATGRVDGRVVLGRTIAQVTAVLGRPDFRVGPPLRHRIGYGPQGDFSTEVIFRRTGGVQRAWSIVFRHGAVRDVKIGQLLRRSSQSLQASILSGYRDAFRLVRAYACRPPGNCVGEFASRSGAHPHLTFGTGAPGTWVTLWQP